MHCLGLKQNHNEFSFFMKWRVNSPSNIKSELHSGSTLDPSIIKWFFRNEGIVTEIKYLNSGKMPEKLRGFFFFINLLIN